jgi:hypothetical protein
MGKHASISPAELPLSASAALLLSYPRQQLEALREALIAAQDLAHSDPDLEEDDGNDSEHDGREPEDGF